MTKKVRVISDNDMHVLMTQFIDATSSIHTAMCLFDDDHPAQKHLNEAMQSVLIGAEQCRQLHGSGKFPVPAGDEWDPED